MGEYTFVPNIVRNKHLQKVVDDLVMLLNRIDLIADNRLVLLEDTHGALHLHPGRLLEREVFQRSRQLVFALLVEDHLECARAVAHF